MEQEAHPFATLRPLERGDIEFVFSTWMNGVRRMPPFKWMYKTIFKKHHAKIEKLLARGDTIVACDKEAPTLIIGWMNYERFETSPPTFVLHYIHVKRKFRLNDVAALMLREVFPEWRTTRMWYSHRTHAMKDIEGPWRASYNPYTVEANE